MARPLSRGARAARPARGSHPARRASIVRLVTAPPKARIELSPEQAAERERANAEERAIAERAQSGDKAAMAMLLRKYGPVLYRSVLLPRLGSEAVAQDALADTYVRVVERFSQFEWRGCCVYPWLRVIALRIALDMLRARRRESLFEPADLERAVEVAEADVARGLDVELCEQRDRAAAKEKVDQALGAINSRYAAVIRMRVLEEKSRDEAAHALGVTVATLDVVLHRALTALKKALGGEDSVLLGGEA